MAPSVSDTCARTYTEATGASAERADARMIEMQRERNRYVADAYS